MSMTWDGLSEALSAAPDLSNAACEGQWLLFDPPDFEEGERPQETRDRHQKAKALCQSCPVYDDCFAWATTLLPGDVSGVLAGVYRKPPTRSLPPFRRRDVA